MKTPKILVTGAGGFVASGLIRNCLESRSYKLRILARNTNPNRLKARLFNHKCVSDSISSGRLEVIYGDLLGDLSGICEGIDYVIHAAAKTYVDHSIKDPYAFIENNILGTYKIIEDAKRHKVSKFLMVSTDEVLGEILSGAYTEDAPPNPRNPYAFSKLSCEGMAMSYAHTFGLHTIITRMENIYGCLQHPQKVFPTFVKHACNDCPLPVYGRGEHVRQWLHLSDAISAFFVLLESETKPGEVFHIAGNRELTNLDLAKSILKILNKPETQIKFIDDFSIRPGHDRRYALNSDKIQKLGWHPEISLHDGIAETVNWYRDNKWWLE